MDVSKMDSKKKRFFSLKFKLLLIFSVVMTTAIMSFGFSVSYTTRQTVKEKIETHIKDKANDASSIINEKILQLFVFSEKIARMPFLLEGNISNQERNRRLKAQALFNKKVDSFSFYNLKRENDEKNSIDVREKQFYKEALKGNRTISELIVESSGNTFLMFAVPVYDDAHNIRGILTANVLLKQFSDEIKHIKMGEQSEIYILDQNGNKIISSNFSLNDDSFNSSSDMKQFENKAINYDGQFVGYYNLKWGKTMASFSKIKDYNWVVFIHAPVDYFMQSVEEWGIVAKLMGLISVIISTIIVYIISVGITKPVKATAKALKNIASGEGDLTVRLEIHGNDEITDLSLYFNDTIKKISTSIKNISGNAEKMEEISSELSSNMTETASSVHEISSNIESIKKQTFTQAASVTETANTIEEITKTIKGVNASIENQAASVSQSSSSIEEMVANIKSITETLEKTDVVIRSLGEATADGKETLVHSNMVTQKIAEESGGLMEASAVIQHIASQTNLLAMNAAIEASHAGEAGKGFAVVADEIRKLAEESSVQGKNITSTLKALSGEIEGLSESSKIVETKFNAIFNLTEKVKGISERLTEAMKEQENGSKEVLVAIKDINSVTSEVQQGSSEMLKGSEGMTKEMQKLDGLTRVITDSMDEMTQGAIYITNAMQEVAEIAQKNKASIQGLVKEVGKFKV